MSKGEGWGGDRGSRPEDGSAPEKKTSRSPQDFSCLQLGNDGRHERRPVVGEVVGGDNLDGFSEDVSDTLVCLSQEGLQDVGPERGFTKNISPVKS